MRTDERVFEDRVLERLRCPVCRKGRPVRSGTTGHEAPSPSWICDACNHAFHEDSGIPLFLDETEARAQRSEHSGDAQRLDDDAQAEYWSKDQSHRGAEHRVVKGFASQRWAYLARCLPIGEIATALDVGCGSGFSTLYAPKHMSLACCDRSLFMLKQNRSDNVVCSSAWNLPFEDDAFDLVYSWELLHHVEEPHRALEEMARVSRKYVVAFEPNPYNAAQLLFALYDREHRWVLRYRKSYFVSQFRRAGLEVQAFLRGGTIFPNKTPGWLYRLLRLLPYRLPLVGISQLAVATKPASALTR